MTIERTNPDGLHPTPGYHHVTRVRADTLIYLAGQCPLQPSGDLAEGGLEAQTEQVIQNILVALDAAGAKPEDVVRTVIYVASPDREELAAVWTQLNASPLAAAFTSASTLLGVAQLGFPGQLVEIDVTAALADGSGPGAGRGRSGS
ncbi:RidA family protein [Kribbella sp. NPDC023972]|uniref:RidA family protein n=1 Tax=Kribbella sp. NPDC023972 TaxID=3154795 RepID=UPI00340F5D2A